jgi:hypothetical protein
MESDRICKTPILDLFDTNAATDHAPLTTENDNWVQASTDNRKLTTES